MKKIILFILCGYFTGCVLSPVTMEEKSQLEFSSKVDNAVPTPITLENSCGNDLSEDQKKVSVKSFENTVYKYVRENKCVSCHGDSKVAPPYFATADVESSWKVMLLDAKKVRLDNPEASRVFLRLRDDHHNCSGDCANSAKDMLSAISKWKEEANFSSNCEDLLLTDSLKFPKNIQLPQTEFGLLMLEAEQSENASVMNGRFVIDLDGKASGAKFAYTPIPPENPFTSDDRQIEIRSSDCKVNGDINNYTNGQIVLREPRNHISSGTVTDEGVPVRDGYAPYSLPIMGVMIRPEHRLDYAKSLVGWDEKEKLATGVSNYSRLPEKFLTEGTFNTASLDITKSDRDLGPIDFNTVTLQGDLLQGKIIDILPHFARKSEVFDGDGNFLTNPDLTFVDDQGANQKIYDLFAPPFYMPSPTMIRQKFEIGNLSTVSRDYRRHNLYKLVKELADNFISTDSDYAKIENLTVDTLMRLHTGLQIQMKACDGGIRDNCTGQEDIEIVDGTDVGDLLTYDNVNDILKLNTNGDGFVAGSLGELNAGTAFRRIDLYVYMQAAVGIRNLRSAGSFNHSFYEYTLGSFNLLESVDYSLPSGNENLNLRALFTDPQNELSKDDDRVIFENTLYPVLRSSRCVTCHNDGGNPQFANSNVLTAYNTITSNGFVNFSEPTNSFRKVNNGGEARIVHNCGTGAECDALQASIISEIGKWKTKKEEEIAKLSKKSYVKLTEEQRSPGVLKYRFIAKSSGRYNVWVKIKNAPGEGNLYDLRIVDAKEDRALPAFRGINSLTERDSCQSYSVGDNDAWTWFTPGRSDELGNIDSLGNIKKDDDGNLRSITDTRTYWNLKEGKEYVLEVFERRPGSKLDLVAIDLVNDKDDVLDFQPDILYRDENNISDYDRRVLTYDVSSLLNLKTGEKVYFETEVKLANGGQNYVFRNPRIKASSGVNVRVEDIKVHINKKYKFTDASWTKIKYITGRDRILTYAPLTTLIADGPSKDEFQFEFGKIEVTRSPVADINPRGAPVEIIEGRKCREIDLFMKTVRPILRNARLMFKDENGLLSYINSFPGTRRNVPENPTMYQCMSCHNETHPYFKMTTFDYPEILCAQALSRVDFDNYRQSLLVRGIDGSGIHPKLYFVEELMYNGDMSEVVHYDENNGTRILDGQIRNQADGETNAYFSKWSEGGYFRTYERSDFGGMPSTWSSMSESQRNLARAFMGQISRVSFDRLPNFAELDGDKNYIYTWYDPLDNLMRDLNGRFLSEKDEYNFLTSSFNAISFNKYQRYVPTDASEDLGDARYELKIRKVGDNLVEKTSCPAPITGLSRDSDGNCVKFDLPYPTRSPASMHPEMLTEAELLKAKYRNVIINWIKKEHEHLKNE